MATQDKYTAGWIDITIHDFLEEIDGVSARMKYALITRLDSSPDVATIFGKSKHVVGLEGKYHPLGDGVLLTTRRLLAAQRRSRIFFGFDEIWFFPAPEITGKPEGLIITGPAPIDPEQMDRHATWLTSNRCSLGLGDGVGMNYCLRLRGVAKYIIQAINDSHPPSLDDQRGSA